LLRTAAQAPTSPFHGKKPDDLAFPSGQVHLKEGEEKTGVGFGELLKKTNVRFVRGRGAAVGTFGRKPTLSTHCYGAHFTEVTWDPEIAELRMSRVVTVIDAGRIINPRTARNQIEGAVVMGIGMALLEETQYEKQKGALINSNLADYLVATNPDVPPIDVHFLDYPDTELNEMGVKGLGEIGLAGVAAAITGAVYHATGVRVRNLPVRVENLIDSNRTVSSR